MSELKSLIKEIESELPEYIEVPKKLIKPHKLITAAKEDLSKPRDKRFQSEDQLIYTSKDIFNIYVSKQLIKRALIFTDSLIKLFIHRGHKIEVRTNEKYENYNGTKIIVEGRVFNICIRETRKRVKVKSTASWYYSVYEPTGILSLRIEELNKYQWSDAKILKLEDKLSTILAYCEIRAKKEIKEKIRREAWHKEYELKRKKEEELIKERELDLKKFNDLVDDANRWQQAQIIRNYINAIEKKMTSENDNQEEISNWVKWSKEKVDSYDPLIDVLKK
ncbi:hypothetical protein DFQ03_2829 [Maribacter caenipelagi]|uniref:Uncharacterized protein n=1 Tax=Maribacter caenipelagi TaxID=1447781 RepID=A0A4R7D3V4_9FLAO|nr:hypothetical protein [Maribacter caenipelagi]TDS13536.1 hypothetical protein DFQ03_2829 [Maribacter caenipelagi]